MASNEVRAEKELKFGILTALSGPAAPWGIVNSRSMMLGADEVNQKGGFKVKDETYKWKVVLYDSKYVPAEAVKCLNKAIFSDKINFVAIQGGSPLLACLPLLKQNKILSINDAAGGKSITNPKNPLVFRWNPSIEGTYAANFPYLKEKEGIKTIASMNPDDETGKSAEDAAEYIAKQNDLKIIERVRFERGTKDYTPILTKIISKNPDMIETGMTDPTGEALIAKQARELGYKGVILLAWGPDPVQVVKVAGQLAEGAYLSATPIRLTTPIAQDLYKRYTEKYSAAEWKGQIQHYHTLLPILSAAIEKCQSFDPQKIADTMETMKWDSALGPQSFVGKKYFGIRRQLSVPITLQKIEKGEAMIVRQIMEPPAGVFD
jgi:branched-chain amino acid transport system substrate-binding protein